MSQEDKKRCRENLIFSDDLSAFSESWLLKDQFDDSLATKTASE